MESKHTEGEWAYGYGYRSNAFGIFTKKMLDEGLEEHPICLISPTEKVNETDKANAARIVKCVNAHDELVDIAKQCLFIFSNEANYPEGSIGYRLANKAKDVLIKITGTPINETSL